MIIPFFCQSRRDILELLVRLLSDHYSAYLVKGLPQGPNVHVTILPRTGSKPTIFQSAEILRPALNSPLKLSGFLFLLTLISRSPTNLHWQATMGKGGRDPAFFLVSLSHIKKGSVKHWALCLNPAKRNICSKCLHYCLTEYMCVYVLCDIFDTESKIVDDCLNNKLLIIDGWKMSGNKLVFYALWQHILLAV